jgi:hypothetical protein
MIWQILVNNNESVDSIQSTEFVNKVSDSQLNKGILSMEIISASFQYRFQVIFSSSHYHTLFLPWKRR